MRRWFWLALAGCASVGCNLLLDIGEHRAAGAVGGPSGSGGAGGATGGAAAAGGAGAAGAGGTAGCGGAQPTVLATDQQSPAAIVVDSTAVWWINEPGGGKKGALVRYDRLEKTSAAWVTGLANPVGLGKGSVHVYYTEDFNDDGKTPGIYIVSKTAPASPKLVIADGLGAGTLHVRYPSLYSEAWSPDEPVRLRYKDVSSPPSQCYLYEGTTIGARITAIDTSDKHVFFAEQHGSTGRIWRGPLSCGSSEPVVLFADNQPVVTGLFAWFKSTDVFMFWLTPDAFWQQKKLEPETMPVLLATGLKDAAGLDSSGLTFAITSLDGSDGRIMTVKQGSSPEVVACGQSNPRHLTIPKNEATIFWTNQGSGEVMSLPLR